MKPAFSSTALHSLILMGLSLFTALFSADLLASNNCPQWQSQTLEKLGSRDAVDFCALTQGKVTLIVNTASECGFTPQFEGLEKLYQKYKEHNFIIVGFPSDSFFQEHDDSKKTEEVCYVNYGVTFPMMSSSKVRGGKANPIFQHLKEAKGSPKWNFYKYLVSADGTVIDWYNSSTKPNDPKLIAAIEQALGLTKEQKKQ